MQNKLNRYRCICLFLIVVSVLSVWQLVVYIRLVKQLDQIIYANERAIEYYSGLAGRGDISEDNYLKEAR